MNFSGQFPDLFITKLFCSSHVSCQFASVGMHCALERFKKDSFAFTITYCPKLQLAVSLRLPFNWRLAEEDIWCFHAAVKQKSAAKFVQLLIFYTNLVFSRHCLILKLRITYCWKAKSVFYSIGQGNKKKTTTLHNTILELDLSTIFRKRPYAQSGNWKVRIGFKTSCHDADAVKMLKVTSKGN